MDILYDRMSHSSSPAVSTSSGHEDDRGGYLDMTPISLTGSTLPTVKEQVRTSKTLKNHVHSNKEFFIAHTHRKIAKSY